MRMRKSSPGAARRIVAVCLAAGMLLGLAAEARAAGVVVRTSLPDGPPTASGTRFRVRIDVRDNTMGLVPIACSFRIQYRSDIVDLLSVESGDLGTVMIGSQQGTPPEVFKAVASLGNYHNDNLNPWCMTLTFRVIDAGRGFHDVRVEGDPIGTTLLARDFTTAIPFALDNEATTALGIAPPPRPDPALAFDLGDPATEPWAFFTAPPFAAPVADRVTGPDGGYLELRATNNTSTFGYLESGAVNFSPRTSLYTAEFFVRSPDADRRRTPQLRLRSTALNLQQSRFMTLESRDDGLSAPGQDGTTYTLVLAPGEAAEQAMLEFELLNFEPNDNPEGGLRLERLRLARRDPADLQPRIRLREFHFDSGPDGWIPYSTPAFSTPHFETQPGALVIRGNGRADTFGYWSSPPLLAGRPSGAGSPTRPIYIATFEVASDASISNRERIPQFRVRINDHRGRAAAFMAIESRGEALLSPVAGIANTYALYFVPPVGLADQSLLLSFDYLNFEPADDADTALALRSVKLEAADFPWE